MGNIDDFTKKKSRFERFINKWFGAKYSIVWMWAKEVIKQRPEIVDIATLFLGLWVIWTCATKGGVIMIALVSFFVVTYVIDKIRKHIALEKKKKVIKKKEGDISIVRKVMKFQKDDIIVNNRGAKIKILVAHDGHYDYKVLGGSENIYKTFGTNKNEELERDFKLKIFAK